MKFSGRGLCPLKGPKIYKISAFSESKFFFGLGCPSPRFNPKSGLTWFKLAKEIWTPPNAGSSLIINFPFKMGERKEIETDTQIMPMIMEMNQGTNLSFNPSLHYRMDRFGFWRICSILDRKTVAMRAALHLASSALSPEKC